MSSATEIAALLREVSQEVEDAINEMAALGWDQNVLEDCLAQAEAEDDVNEAIILETMIDIVERKRLECAEFIGEMMEESNRLRQVLRERYHS